MANSNLTQARLREVLHYDPESGIFRWLVATSDRMRIGSIAGTVETGKYPYIQIQIDGRRFRGQRLAWLYMTGLWPTHVVDHIDRKCSHNRWENLRAATVKQNAENQPPRPENISGFRGVRWMKKKKKWIARIKHNGVEIYLGIFTNKEDAIFARKAAEERLFTHSTPQSGATFYRVTQPLQV